LTEIVVENTPKHATDDLEIIFSGEHARTPRIFSHSQLHLGLDSYVNVFNMSTLYWTFTVPLESVRLYRHHNCGFT